MGDGHKIASVVVDSDLGKRSSYQQLLVIVIVLVLPIGSEARAQRA